MRGKEKGEEESLPEQTQVPAEEIGTEKSRLPESLQAVRVKENSLVHRVPVQEVPQAQVRESLPRQVPQEMPQAENRETTRLSRLSQVPCVPPEHEEVSPGEVLISLPRSMSRRLPDPSNRTRKRTRLSRLPRI